MFLQYFATSTIPNSFANSFRTLGWSSSGPKALDGFRPLRSFVTPSFEIVVTKEGVTKLLKGLNPSKALGPDELYLSSDTESINF